MASLSATRSATSNTDQYRRRSDPVEPSQQIEDTAIADGHADSTSRAGGTAAVPSLKPATAHFDAGEAAPAAGVSDGGREPTRGPAPVPVEDLDDLYRASEDLVLIDELGRFVGASDEELRKVFGAETDLDGVHGLQSELRAGDTGALPDARIAKMPDEVKGAYADGQIYLNENLSEGERRATYREELGHVLDERAHGGRDSVGDEGARFRQLTSGEEIRPELGDDHGAVDVAGKTQAAEFSRAAAPGEPLVTVYRVEGPGNTRVLPDAQGDPHLLKSFQSTARSGFPDASPNEAQYRDALFLNFGDKKRAEDFARTRLAQGHEGTIIKRFEIPKSLADSIRKSAVPEDQARNPQFSKRPIKVDVNATDDSFGLRWEDTRKINEQMISGSFKAEKLGADGAFHEIPISSPLVSGKLPRGTPSEISARSTQIVENLQRPAGQEARALQIADAAHFVAANPGSPAASTVRESLDRLGVDASERGAAEAVESLLADPATRGAASHAGVQGVAGAAFKWGGRAFLVAGAVADGYKIYSADDKKNAVAQVAGGWTGGLAGAEAGAALGAAGGPIGAAVGGLVGGALGYFGGSWFGDWLEKKVVPKSVHQEAGPARRPASEPPF